VKSAAFFLLFNAFIVGAPETDRYCSLVSDYATSHYPSEKIGDFLYVSVRHQQAFFIRNGSAVFVIPVSTAAKGTGSKKDSEQTPLGMHRIKGCTGKNAPVNGVLDKNGYTGKTAIPVVEAVSTGKDLITTRAYRLDGTEKGKNKGGLMDSYSRDIMIHGTPEEGLIGLPVSHGCIRMKNSDILQLAPYLKDGLRVLILNY
jgi:hypothetical protein